MDIISRITQMFSGKKEDNKIRKIGNDTLAYYDTWIHSVVRELAPILSNVNAVNIAKSADFVYQYRM